MCKVFQLEILTSFGNCSSCWMVTELEQFQSSTKRKLYNCLWWTKGTHSQSFLSQLFQNYCFTSVIWGRKFLCTGSSLRSSIALLFWAGVFENLDIKKASGPDGLYNCDEEKAHTLNHFFHSCFKTTVSDLRKFLCTGCSHRSSKTLLFWAGVFKNLDRTGRILPLLLRLYLLLLGPQW